MTKILTDTGYITMDKFETMLSMTPKNFSASIIHALTDANNGKVFSIVNFPLNCIIKEIRVRSNFVAGQQIWRIALIANVNGIAPIDTSITCTTAEIFSVGDYIYIDDEIAYASAVDNVNNIITVTRGLKGTTPSYHDYGSRMETANNGLRLVLFNSGNRKLANRVKILDNMFTWKGVTGAAINSGDKVIMFANSPLNIGKYDYLYLVDGTNSERASVEEPNGIVSNAVYNNSVYVADYLLAHALGIEVYTQIVYDFPITYINGNGNLYMTLYVDEKIDSTIYPNGINVTIDVITVS